jgi:ubiquinone/menaquinone biosynthesis C-methylase UbiE
MLKVLLRALDERVLFPARTNYLIDKLTPHLREHSSVLDFGASDGRLAYHLQSQLDCIFTCCDVYPQEKQFVPVVKFDGDVLPFEDSSFDCVMLIDVLHHDSQPEKVLAEAVRVARSTVLVKDHIWATRLDFFGLKVMDYIGNAPYGISLPYNYLTADQWYQMAADLQLTIAAEERYRYNLIDPCRHITLRLNKSG